MAFEFDAYMVLGINPQRGLAAECATDRQLLGSLYDGEDNRMVQTQAARRSEDWLRRCAALGMNWRAHTAGSVPSHRLPCRPV
jgi:hypothetical protein